MANSLCFTSVCSFNTPNKPGIIIDNSVPRKVLRVNEVFKSTRNARIRSLEAKVPNSVINAKVLELILLITSMDNLKLVGCVGFAGGKGRFYVGVVMELASLVDL